MAKSFDQYLANRLTNEGLFRVVTDPKRADAIFTDRIGQGFQAQLEAISPTPPPPPPPAPPAPPEDAAAAPGADKSAAAKPEAKREEESKAALPFTDTVNQVDNPALNSSFGRGKGTIFLVEAKSRQVIWSVYDPSKDGASKTLDHTASDIVNRLKKDMKKK
jgi:hypothetical protein